MESGYLREALLKRKKKRGVEWSKQKERMHDPEAKDDGLSPGKILDVDMAADSDDTGQMKMAKGYEIENGYSKMHENMEQKAEQVLGRKPMSTVKKKDDDDDYEEFDTDPEVLASMKDERLIERMREGKRKPKNIWERVQMNIARKTK